MSTSLRPDKANNIVKNKQSGWQKSQAWEQHLPASTVGHPRGSVWVFKQGRAPFSDKVQRPYLIVSNDVNNTLSDQLIVVMLTENKEEKKLRVTTEVLLRKSECPAGLLETDSVVECRNIFTVKNGDLFKRWGEPSLVPKSKMKEISACLDRVLALSALT